MRCLVLGSLVIVLVAAPAAQAPVPAELRFDVASVKPNRDARDPFGFDFGFDVRPDGLWFRNLSLQEYIGFAHDMGLNARGRIIGGPSDLLSERFTIEAKAAGRVTPTEIRAMLRTLLAERFNLNAHMETREIPVFALTRVRADRLGKDLQPSQIADCRPVRLSIETLANLRAPRCPRSIKMETSGAVNKVESGPIEALIASLEEIVTSRPIIDATGLEGMFEWRLRYQELLPDDPDAPSAPFVLDAVPEQLGLKLEPRNSPFQVLVIDSVARPTLD